VIVADPGATATPFVVPPHWRAIELLSDVHLGEHAPRTFDAWSRHLQTTDADAVFILGDLFEVWIGDDAVSGAFERRCVQALKQAAQRCVLAFLAGNRDFLVGPALLAEVPMRPLEDGTVLDAWGERLVLCHGDALCLADTEYQAFRGQVRSAPWQADFLGRPLAERAQIAARIRGASQARKQGLPDPELWADVDADAAVALLHRAGATTLIHGHTHRPGRHVLAPGLQRLVLSDWDADCPAPRGDVLRLTPAGIERRAVLPA
jgi:UDP-2,3-diacylglucosamine hydrolase